MSRYFLTLGLLMLFLCPDQACADARKSSFKNSFSDSKKARQFMVLGGTYSVDQNSKQYKISSSYQYQNNRYISEADFLYDLEYGQTVTRPMHKKQQLYDLELSTKIMIADSSNYFNYYNRSKYDPLSDYYYDLTNAVCWGRMFFDGFLEADFNIGYDEIRNYTSQIIFNPTLKANFNVTDNIKLSIKAYIFQVHYDYYNSIKGRLIYRITNNVSFEIFANYERKRYFHNTMYVQKLTTDTQKNLIARIRYEF